MKMSTDTPQISASKNAPLERNKRLSQSSVWRMMRNFYARQGIEAWRKERIPLHITSNTCIAHAYARVVEGFLADCREEIDPSHPIYVVEFGAGSGRFSFLFLKALLDIPETHRHDRRMSAIRYVLTDVAESNVQYWEGHPQLRPFFDAGILDTAVADLRTLEGVQLTHSRTVLSPETLVNPLVAVANYVFDTVPQDAFLMSEGELSENLLTIGTGQSEPEPDAPEILSRLRLSFAPNLAKPDYYEDPGWNVLLQSAQKRLPSGPFLFPVSALECVGGLQRISGGKCLLISADKGYNRDEALMAGLGAPAMVRHADGCFSMMVDYRTIGDYVEQQGGMALHPSHSHESLNISAFVIGDTGRGEFLFTRGAYQEAVERFGPDDLFTLMPVFDAAAASMSVEQTIACLRLSHLDHRLLWTFLPVWKAQAPELSPVQKRELAQTIRRAWDLYYSIREEGDLAFNLGVLMLEFGLYTEALEFLRCSEDRYGPASGTAYNIGVCHYHRQEKAEALMQVARALEFDSDFDSAKALRILVESSL
jgi:tetratricopeptide (TPR) repeat protein